MATGQVLFQRFYYSKSFVKHNMEVRDFKDYSRSLKILKKYSILSVTMYLSVIYIIFFPTEYMLLLSPGG